MWFRRKPAGMREAVEFALPLLEAVSGFHRRRHGSYALRHRVRLEFDGVEKIKGVAAT
jgi:hypothetical protein